MPTIIEDVPVAQRKFLNLPTASAYAGISIVSLRRLISAGKLLALRPVKGRIVLDRQALEQFIGTSSATPRTGRGLNKGEA